MPEVELIYDGDCPNAEAARTRLMRALAQAGVEARWTEWQADDPSSPEHVRGYGSPTILVDGRDVVEAEGARQGSRSCRVYERPDGTLGGVPPIAAIVAALKGPTGGVCGGGNGGGGSRSGRTRFGLAMLPGVGAALLPKVACPACWPAYAGFLSATGLGFLMDDRFLLPLTAVFLAVAVGALAFRAKRRRGYGPFVVGLAASLAILAGKFAAQSDAATYAGVALLVAASVWNGWPRRRSPECPACVEPAMSVNAES